MLDIRHRTHYRYGQAAVFSQHLLRLTPGPAAGQRVIITDLSISPKPDTIERHQDFFGNVVHVATVAHTHAELEITATARVDRAPRQRLMLDTSAPWEHTRNVALGIGGATPGSETSPFAFPSSMTAADDALEDYARAHFTPGRPVLVAAEEFCKRIYTDFAYTPGITQADTLPTESFRLKKGVCQDFAHVMLAG
ncbi:MAG: transglutaminase N-terminal domain-containing protein, partial [Pseudomonadota bacterium]